MLLLKCILKVLIVIVPMLFSVTEGSEPDQTLRHYSYNHIPPVGIYEHEDICLRVFIEQISEGDEARVQFRVREGDSFHMMPLGYDPAERRFVTCIDERFHRNIGIEYYIELFPAGMAPIRIPETSGKYHQVRIRKRFSRIGRPILIAFLIASPAIALFLYSKIKTIHKKRKAEYESRLRARRKKLHKEREKHYQEYLKTLTGRKPPPSRNARSGNSKKPSVDPKQKPDIDRDNKSRNEPKISAGKPTDSKISTKDKKPDTDTQLKHELDNILNSKHDRKSPDLSEHISGGKGKKSSRSDKNKAGKTGLLNESDELSDEDKRKLLELFDD